MKPAQSATAGTAQRCAMRPNIERGEHGTENASSCSGPNVDPYSTRWKKCSRVLDLIGLGHEDEDDLFAAVSGRERPG